MKRPTSLSDLSRRDPAAITRIDPAALAPLGPDTAPVAHAKHAAPPVTTAAAVELDGTRALVLPNPAELRARPELVRPCARNA